MDITTALVHEHEIAKESDFMFGFESIIRNTMLLDRMLVSSNADYVIGGKVLNDPNTMDIFIEPVWGNGIDLTHPVYSDKKMGPFPINPTTTGNRRDLIQLKGVLEEYDSQRRAFFDPDLEDGRFFNVNTKLRLIVEIQIKQGIEGNDDCPETDQGWIKLAEVFVEYEKPYIEQGDIKNITSIYQGSENSTWTIEKTRTFMLGSQLELRIMFGTEHNIDGTHKEHVIRPENLLIGKEAGKLNAKIVPLGENFTSGGTVFLNTDFINEAFKKEAESRYAKDNLQDEVLGEHNRRLEVLELQAADGATDVPTPGRITKFDMSAKLHSGADAENPDEVIRKHDLNLRAQTFKLFNNKSLMITNAGTALRRRRGWDIGVQYLSAISEVYHFDTDLFNQNQETNLDIEDVGTAPILVGKKDKYVNLSLAPAVSDLPPCEENGKSLFGQFSVGASVNSNTSTIEFWARIFPVENQVILRFGSDNDTIVLQLGGVDPEYSAAAEGDPEYSIAAEGDPPYSVATTSENSLIHNWPNGTESFSIDDAGIEIIDGTWMHFALVVTQTLISLFIADNKIDVTRQSQAQIKMDLTLNESKETLNLDELTIDQVIALSFDEFLANSELKIPYAALSMSQPWTVLELKDITKVKTNLFDTDVFKAAVQAVIDNQ